MCNSVCEYILATVLLLSYDLVEGNYFFPVPICLCDYGPALFGPGKNTSSGLPHRLLGAHLFSSSFCTAFLFYFLFALG